MTSPLSACAIQNAKEKRVSTTLKINAMMITESAVVDIGNPLVKLGGDDYPNAGKKDHYRRVNRFIRHGVDKLMEMTQEENFFIRTYKESPNAMQNFRRVAFFAAPGVERKQKVPNQEPKDYKHITCFVASGIVKGEGHLGGGTVPHIPDIGFNPMHNFNEHRVKRQNIAKISKKFDTTHYGIKKSMLHTIQRKTSLENLLKKREREDAVADIRDHECRKLQRKKNEKEQKRKEYEAIRRYNPWGQPAAGAPKITRTGNMCPQIGGGSALKKSSSDENYNIFGLPKIVRENSSEKRKDWRRQKIECLSDFEKNKIQKEKERREYYAKYLEKQKSEEKQKTEQAQREKEKFVPKDFIWGRTDVERTLSGKLIPRKRQLYQLDHGTIQKSYKTYYSIADKMARIPDHRPVRGLIDHHSYQHWGGKPGSQALMRCRAGGNDKAICPATEVQGTSPSTSMHTGNTVPPHSHEGGVAEGGRAQLQTTSGGAPIQSCEKACNTATCVQADAAVQYESHD